MKSKKGVFSNNFVLVHEDDLVSDVLQIIDELKPEYIIIKRRKEEKIYRYVFLASLLEKYLRQGAAPTAKLSSLVLHEYESSDTKELQTMPTGTDDYEIKEVAEKFTASSTASGKLEFLIIKHKNEIVGIIDPKRNQDEKSYYFRGVEEHYAESKLTSKGSTLDRVISRSHRLYKDDTLPIMIGSGITSHSMSPPPRVVRIERYPACEIPSEIEKTKSGELKIQLNLKPSGQDATPLTIHPAPDEPIVIGIELYAEPSNVIEFIGGNKKEITMPHDGNSKPVSFVVLGKETGWVLIRCEFFFKGMIAGLIHVKTHVVEKIHGGKAPEKSESEGKLDIPKQKRPDLSIRIREEKKADGLELKFTIESEPCGYEPAQDIKETIKITTEPEQYFRTLFEEIEKRFGVRTNDNQVIQHIVDKLKNKGMELYDKLFPAELKEFYWSNRENIKTISIMSDEPWIPWEIIKPTRQVSGKTEEDSLYLCERFAISRWLNGILYKNKSQIKHVKVIIPNKINLPSAIAECDWIETMSSERGYRVTRDSTYSQVKSSLVNGGFDLLHFSTHGLYNKKDSNDSQALLSNELALTPEDINGEAKNFGMNNPIIVMNACQTGQQGFSLVGIGGWAEKFLKAQASAFIGTLWSVNDRTAFKFTRRLYDKLHAGIPLDEAVKEARLDAKTDGDTTWLAYTVFCRPNAVCRLGDI